MAGTLISTYENGVNTVTGEIGIEQILTATVEAPFGNCKELQFIGRNDVLQVDATNIVQYLEDTDAIFWGPLIVYPSKDSTGAGPETDNPDAHNQFIVAGGAYLLEKSILGPKAYDIGSYDIADQMRQMGMEFGHPALSWPSTEMPLVSITSNVIASPYRNFKDLFDKFQEVVPNSFYGVDALGQVFFKVLT